MKIEYNENGKPIVTQEMIDEWSELMDKRVSESVKVINEAGIGKNTRGLMMEFLFIKFIKGEVNEENLIEQIKDSIIDVKIYKVNIRHDPLD